MATKRTSASKRAATVEVSIIYPESSSRLLNGLFLKWLLVIPHLIVLSLFAVLVGFLMFFAWVGIWINGRYPRRLWEVNASYLRYTTRVNAYLVQLTDEYPAYPENPLTTSRRRR
ncbi:MAG: DUF4389 domain-containing protein [Candidatus Limnocylindrus sp.]|jgi:hypothetical protein